LLGINQQRDALQARLREREAPSKAAASHPAAAGEASHLRNQLAQMEEYLASIERETARSVREEQLAAAEIERLEAARQSLTEIVAARQLELESVTGERRRTEEDLAARRQAAAELRQTIDQEKTEVSRIRARKESLDRCWLTAATPPNR